MLCNQMEWGIISSFYFLKMHLILAISNLLSLLKRIKSEQKNVCVTVWNYLVTKIGKKETELMCSPGDFRVL